MKRIGREGKKWLKFRREFLKTRTNWYGSWDCQICLTPTDYPEVDHIQKRGSHQELKYSEANLRILCGRCHARRHGNLLDS